ncbi:MAG: filamentous hemagglutinin family protein, partial [Terrimicrobiaceae bacterium]
IYRPTSTTRRTSWASATINLSDANPANIAGVFTPFGLQSTARDNAAANQNIPTAFLLGITNLFDESGSSSGEQALIQTQQALHGTSVLHANDSEPVRIYSGLGDISGLTLYSSKAARIVAGGDISDIAFYIQNTKSTDVSIVSSGGDIRPWNDKSLLRVAATRLPGNALNNAQTTLPGDIQISGPGALALLAGGNLDFGTGASDPNGDGLGIGLTSIGNARNPNLPFAGADLIVGAGIGPVFSLANLVPDAGTFLESVLSGDNASTYLAELAASNTELASFLNTSGLSTLSADLRAKLALELFFLVLRDAGRAYSDPADPSYQQSDAYVPGFEAIGSLFGSLSASGDITTRSRDIRTKSGGDISMLVPGGGLTLTTTTVGTSLTPPGIVTEAGGNISIFANNDVDIGISRIFTLRGGNEIIWSSTGDIAAGASSKTVQSAPPTRVLIDPQSAALNVDLAGIATGGGIGVLATVEGVPPGSVDLIAPVGAVDAGDAGIRATGNLNIAAVQVLNADNISVGGTRAGVPTAPVVAAPNIGGLTSGSSSSGAAASAAESVANQAQSGQNTQPDLPSVITVEVLGYGGDDEG